MYLQELVEVAIGLIFAWLLLSLATMQVQEMIASFLAKRANDLENTIRGMLEDPGKVRELYNHPLIKSLSKPVSEKKQKTIDELDKKVESNMPLTTGEKINLWWIKPKPSYIPSKNFAIALFDVVANAGTDKSPIHSTMNELKGGIEKLAEGDRETAKVVIDNVYQMGALAAKSQAGSKFQAGIKKELQNQIKLLGDNYKNLRTYTDQLLNTVNDPRYNLETLFKSDLLLEQVRTGAKAIGANKSLERSLGSLLAGAEEYATAADKALAIGRANVEEWFNSTMDRMGGWYKRWAQVWAFFIALVVAVAFNIDSIHIAEELWRNPAMRQASTTYIQNFVNDKTKDGKPLSDTDLQTVNAQIQKLDFPIGWDKISKEENKSEWWFWFVKSIGYLITAGAAMQGAPFWFDILKKLVNVRSSGINPAEKPKEIPAEKE